MNANYKICEVIGLEIEYMIVAQDTLNVLPIADQLFYKTAGSYAGEIDRGVVSWSNELALHVLELKLTQPVSELTNIGTDFQKEIDTINQTLLSFGARLLPTSMHPLMNPKSDTKLWPHENREIYEAFHRIFNCYNHGWANLQASQINLPFFDDADFARLHAAIRIVLPILPALAASSPIYDGRYSGYFDSRMQVYQHNANRVPSLCGDLIPEPIFSQAAYEKQLLEKLYQEIKPYDVDNILQHEWINARGAIARFDRNTIEIRVLDSQECVSADLAVAHLVVETVRALTQGAFGDLAKQQAFPTTRLRSIFQTATKYGDQARIDDIEYLQLFGLEKTCKSKNLWQHIFSKLPKQAQSQTLTQSFINTYLDQGCLARRLTSSLGTMSSRERVVEVYKQLSDCLSANRMFRIDL